MLPGDAAEPEGTPGETLPPPAQQPEDHAVDVAAEGDLVAEPKWAAFAEWLDHELEQLELRWAPFAAPAAMRDVKLRISR